MRQFAGSKAVVAETLTVRRRLPALAVLVFTLAIALAVPHSAEAVSVQLGSESFGSIAVDNAQDLVFVSEPKENAVVEFDFAGNLIRTVPNLYGAWGMTISGHYLYVAESTAGAIVRVDLDTTSPSETTVASGLIGPEWLVMAAGRLWVTENINSEQSDEVLSVDPATGATTRIPGTFYDADLAVSPGDPSALFVAEDGLSPGAIYRFDVSTDPATQVAHNAATAQENLEGLAISPDGSRVIPASGAPYYFGELASQTLQADGLRYPGQAYPSAVAVSSSGFLAAAVRSGSPNVCVYKIGTPAPVWSGATYYHDSGRSMQAAAHGLALSADGSRLFAVSSYWDGSGSWQYAFDAFTVTPTQSPTACDGSGSITGSGTASPLLGAVAAPGSGTVGTKIDGSSVSSALLGSASGTGTISFVVFGPLASAPSDCSSGGTPVGTASVSSDGTYIPNADFTPSQAGDYWWYASYGGDSNNNAVNSGCGDGMAETVVAPPDNSPPHISIFAPGENGPYARYQLVEARYSCADPDLAACLGPVPSGSLFPTGAVGAHSFTVTATDTQGNQASLTRRYTVFAANGSGQMAASPASVSASSTHHTLTFSYHAGEGGIWHGALSLFVPNGWSAPSTSPAAPGYVTASEGKITTAGRRITVSIPILASLHTMTITYGSMARGGPGATSPGTTRTHPWPAKEKSVPHGALTRLLIAPQIRVT